MSEEYKKILELYRKLSQDNRSKILKEMDYLLNRQNINVIIELENNKNTID